MASLENIPKHVSIIMDGNGRWAKQLGRKRLFGHKAGVEAVRRCSEYAVEKGIKYLSLFAFSEENWNRPESEIKGLMEIMANAILKELPTFHKNKIKFQVLGNLSIINKNLVAEIKEAEKETKDYDSLNLIIFLSYSGKWDIMQSVEQIAQEAYLRGKSGEEPRKISYSELEKNLCTNGIPDPDLLIRTSGEQRFSNYLLWQCAYTELYFTKVLWPDFRKKDFQDALDSFNSRERRYGKTSAQINKNKNE